MVQQTKYTDNTKKSNELNQNNCVYLSIVYSFHTKKFWVKNDVSPHPLVCPTMSNTSVDIDGLVVGKSYTLESTGQYLGKLMEEPQIWGSGDGREKYAVFVGTMTTSVPRWKDYERRIAHRFLSTE